MPLPKPRMNETRSEFVSRCIEFETRASPDTPRDQIAKMCYVQWDNFKTVAQSMWEGRDVLDNSP